MLNLSQIQACMIRFLFLGDLHSLTLFRDHCFVFLLTSAVVVLEEVRNFLKHTHFFMFERS